MLSRGAWSVPEGVLDLRPGLLEVSLGLVTAALGLQAPVAGEPAECALGSARGTACRWSRALRAQAAEDAGAFLGRQQRMHRTLIKNAPR
jgi:hypothetical protein